MKNLSVNIFVLLTVALATVNAENYTLYLISQQNGAACLDGSAPGLYVYEGKN